MENPTGFTFAPQPSFKQQSHTHNRMPQFGSSQCSPRVKRKRSVDDVDMDSPSPCAAQEHVSQQGHSPMAKRTRNLPIGRPLPLSRLLDDMDKPGLQQLVKNLCERHPGLSNEIYKHATKPTVSRALGTLAVLERNVQTSFPFGGDVKGEYAYNRVLPSIKELLNALMDYVPHFLPPNEEHALETLSFLDGATAIISRLPDWNNPNHALAKREAFEEMSGAWIQGFREASKKGAGVGAASFLDKLRRWNEVSDNVLTSAVQAAVQELGWIEREPIHTTGMAASHYSAKPGYGSLHGLFSR